MIQGTLHFWYNCNFFTNQLMNFLHQFRMYLLSHSIYSTCWMCGVMSFGRWQRNALRTRSFSFNYHSFHLETLLTISSTIEYSGNRIYSLMLYILVYECLESLVRVLSYLLHLLVVDSLILAYSYNNEPHTGNLNLTYTHSEKECCWKKWTYVLHYGSSVKHVICSLLIQMSWLHIWLPCNFAVRKSMTKNAR